MKKSHMIIGFIIGCLNGFLVNALVKHEKNETLSSIFIEQSNKVSYYAEKYYKAYEKKDTVLMIKYCDSVQMANYTSSYIFEKQTSN